LEYLHLFVLKIVTPIENNNTIFSKKTNPMPIISLQTHISAPIERVFDLSRSIDLHKLSMQKTDEQAVAGKTSGLIGLGETVTWRAKHFGVYQHLTVEIFEMQSPHSFSDRMTKGIFKKMEHQHLFVQTETGCTMTDVFDYQSPLGALGRLADWLFLEKYMRNLLLERNATITRIAKSEI
jgi:ligand-binding SRPBCC domain-containing protein